MNVSISHSVSLSEGLRLGFASGNVFSAPPAQRYLGLDPGLQRTGYAILERRPQGPRMLEGGVIRSTATGSLASRVLEIGSGIRELLEEFQPDAVAIEQIFSQVKHPKAALLMAHARGAILYELAAGSRTPIQYAPRQVKKLLTGSGTASKEQIQDAVRREMGLTEILEPNDVADACAIALCHYFSLRLPVAQSTG